MAADTTGDSGIGTGSECGGERPSPGGGRVAVIDLVARGSGGTSHHSVTPAGLKQSAIEKVSTPANWPFDSMLTRTRARAMKRMMDKSITDSARKKAFTANCAGQQRRNLCQHCQRHDSGSTGISGRPRSLSDTGIA